MPASCPHDVKASPEARACQLNSGRVLVQKWHHHQHNVSRGFRVACKTAAEVSRADVCASSMAASTEYRGQKYARKRAAHRAVAQSSRAETCKRAARSCATAAKAVRASKRLRSSASRTETPHEPAHPAPQRCLHRAGAFDHARVLASDRYGQLGSERQQLRGGDTCQPVSSVQWVCSTRRSAALSSIRQTGFPQFSKMWGSCTPTVKCQHERSHLHHQHPNAPRVCCIWVGRDLEAAQSEGPKLEELRWGIRQSALPQLLHPTRACSSVAGSCSHCVACPSPTRSSQQTPCSQSWLAPRAGRDRGQRCHRGPRRCFLRRGDCTGLPLGLHGAAVNRGTEPKCCHQSQPPRRSVKTKHVALPQQSDPP